MVKVQQEWRNTASLRSSLPCSSVQFMWFQWSMGLLHHSHLYGMNLFDSSDGRVIRASASGAVDLDLIPSRVKPMTLVFTASLLDAQH